MYIYKLTMAVILEIFSNAPRIKIIMQFMIQRIFVSELINNNLENEIYMYRMHM